MKYKIYDGKSRKSFLLFFLSTFYLRSNSRKLVRFLWALHTAFLHQAYPFLAENCIRDSQSPIFFSRLFVVGALLFWCCWSVSPHSHIRLVNFYNVTHIISLDFVCLDSLRFLLNFKTVNSLLRIWQSQPRTHQKKRKEKTEE